MAEEKKGLALSPQEHKRRSDKAKELVASGKLGGANRGQGRKKQVKANEKVADEAARHSQKIIDRLLDVIENGKNAEALNAISMWLKIEAEETHRKSQQEVSELEGKSKDELMKFVIEKLIEKQGTGETLEFVDSTAKDVTEAQVIESGN